MGSRARRLPTIRLLIYNANYRAEQTPNVIKIFIVIISLPPSVRSMFTAQTTHRHTHALTHPDNFETLYFISEAQIVFTHYSTSALK